MANYGIDSAENVVLVGSGNLKGDYLASDILGLLWHCVSVIVNAIVNGTFYLDIFNFEHFWSLGSGARGVGHGCDYLSEAIASVNEETQVKCVLDGPDLTPFWLNDDVAQTRCETSGTEAFLEEQTKQLWGRTDDESCVRDLENELNETELANTCGMFSRYWKHVQTPLFVISSQWNQHDFDQVTCNVDSEDEDFVTYSSGNFDMGSHNY